MHIPALTIRSCLLLVLMLASLMALADGVARHELQQATGEMAYASVETGSILKSLR